MPQTDSSVPDPLSAAERAELTRLLTHTALDTNGLLGVLHAVAIAPTELAPPEWFAVVVPDGLMVFEEAVDAEEFLGFIMRLSNEVADGLAAGKPLVPPHEDEKACEAFAAGFVKGAELDKAWLENAELWSSVGWAAYLAGRPDLAPSTLRAKLDELGDGGKATLRRDMRETLLMAHRTFAAVREAMGGQAAQGGPRPPKTVVHGPSPGRNDPCPCGSGKKFKRCCIDAGTSSLN